MKNLKIFSGVGIAVATLTLGAVLVSAQVAPAIVVSVHDASHATVTSANIGSIVHANVNVASTTGPTVTGTVDVSLYANTTCSGSATTSQTSLVLSGGSVESATAILGSNGFSYKVHYNGDDGASDDYAPADSSCQSIVAKSASVGLSTTLSSTTVMAGTSVSESSILNNTTANATGTVAYKYYTDNACTVGAVSLGTKTVTTGIVPNSDSALFNTVGTFYFKAQYSGDQNNNSAASSCLTLSVLSTTTPPASGTGSIAGTLYNDIAKNKVKDATDPGIPLRTIKLYTGIGWSGPTNRAPIMTATTDANGNYSFSNLADGVYSIEEINQKGWKQITSDYKGVTITNGAHLTGYDFAEASTTIKNGNGHNKDDRYDKKEERKIKNLEKRFERFQFFWNQFIEWQKTHK